MNINEKYVEIYFYFDSKNLFQLLTTTSNPNLYSCSDKGDEFECYIRVESLDCLKTFCLHLKEVSSFSLDEIFELTSEIWEGYGFDILNDKFGEEESNIILDNSEKYLISLFN